MDFSLIRKEISSTFEQTRCEVLNIINDKENNLLKYITELEKQISNDSSSRDNIISEKKINTSKPRKNKNQTSNDVKIVLKNASNAQIPPPLVNVNVRKESFSNFQPPKIPKSRNIVAKSGDTNDEPPQPPPRIPNENKLDTTVRIAKIPEEDIENPGIRATLGVAWARGDKRHRKLTKSYSLRAKSGHDFLSQREDKTKEETKINNAKRVVGADIYRNIGAITAKQYAPTPKKFKDSFEGRALTSFVIEKYHITSREEAIILCRKLDCYIECMSSPGTEFQDVERIFYGFSIPVFMFKEKLEKELPGCLEVLLARRENFLSKRQYPRVKFQSIPDSIRFYESNIEYNPSKKKKWSQRYIVILNDKIQLFKNSESLDPFFSVNLENITLISYDKSKFNIECNTGIPFIIFYRIGDTRKFFCLRDCNGNSIEKILPIFEGLKYKNNPVCPYLNSGILDVKLTSLFLERTNKVDITGGEVKSNEEIWQYSNCGKVCHLGGHLQYHWTGRVFQPAEECEINAGTGFFDGVNLYWFPPSSSKNQSVNNEFGKHKFHTIPTSVYTYQEATGAYFDEKGEKKWLWTRHFLASVDGKHPEWLVEGDIPKVVVMLLQMLRVFTKSYPATSLPSSATKTLAERKKAHFSKGKQVSMDSFQLSRELSPENTQNERKKSSSHIVD